MPFVPPSEIVAHIDRAFPWATQEARASQVMTGFHAPSVGGVMALVARMAPGTLSMLSPADHAAFHAASAALTTSLDMWQSPSHPGLAHSLSPLIELDRRPPMQALRHILAKCPDESPAHAAADLSFLSDPPFEAALLLDMSTATTAVGNSEFKAACVMAGSVIEAVLVWALRRRPKKERAVAFAAWEAARAAAGQDAPRKLPGDVLKWTFEQCIEVARHVPLIDKATAEALSSSREFRNLIHPARAERLKQWPTLGSALVATGSMRLVVDSVRKGVADGTI